MLNYKVIGDSCSDFTEAMKQSPCFEIIPLTLELGSYSVMDDEHFDQKDFLQRVAASPVGPQTACPSPEAYCKAIEAADAPEVYIVTLSEQLSGSYQSAMVGLSLFEEHHPDRMGKKIRVFGSDSAAAGETNLCIDIQTMKAEGKSFEEVSSYLAEKIQRMRTYFVLESLDTLRKNGRLSMVKALLASALNIKPVMSAEHGVIIKIDQKRGMKNALRSMAEHAVRRAGGPEQAKRLRCVISHVNDRDRAEEVKEYLLSCAPFTDIVITEAMGVTTVYAGNRGIVIAL